VHIFKARARHSLRRRPTEPLREESISLARFTEYRFGMIVPSERSRSDALQVDRRDCSR
jgi:hypothetical protein